MSAIVATFAGTDAAEAAARAVRAIVRSGGTAWPEPVAGGKWRVVAEARQGGAPVEPSVDVGALASVLQALDVAERLTMDVRFNGDELTTIRAARAETLATLRSALTPALTPPAVDPRETVPPAPAVQEATPADCVLVPRRALAALANDVVGRKRPGIVADAATALHRWSLLPSATHAPAEPDHGWSGETDRLGVET